MESVSSAVKRLQDVGAFDTDDNLTALGEILATLPVDVRIGKLMLFGAIFQVWISNFANSRMHSNVEVKL